jgi:RNA polymerase sigma-70 factor (ECF subfamily)
MDTSMLQRREGAPNGGGGEHDERVEWDAFLMSHRDRLRRMIKLRLDDRLHGRIDPSDVIQEAYLEATVRRTEYESNPEPMPLFLWLRFITLQRLDIIHRKHFCKARDPRREISIHNPVFHDSTSQEIATRLLCKDSSVGEVAIRNERKIRIAKALQSMETIDRDILVLRHFEQLTNVECARLLGLSESAVTKRHIRALKRLKDFLADLPGGFEGL